MKKFKNIIYLLKIDTPDGRLYKIGSSKNESISKRIQALQTGCPYEIKLSGKFESEFGQIVERTFHNRYKHCRTFGEWFSLDILEELSFLENCKKIEENNITLEKNNLNSYANNRYT